MEDLVLNGAVPYDRPGDELGKEADVQQKIEEIPLDVYLAPIEVDDVGENLERVKADADGQGDGREGHAGGDDAVQRIPKKIGVLEHQEICRHQADRQDKGHFAGLGAAAQRFHSQASGIGHNSGGQHHHNILWLSPGVKEQGEDQEQAVAPGAIFDEEIRQDRQGQEEIEEGQTAEYHGSTLRIKGVLGKVVDVPQEQDVGDPVGLGVGREIKGPAHAVRVIAQVHE